MKLFQNLLTELDACSGAKIWAGNMTVEEVVDKCHRGDWLLWLANKVNVDDRKLTLVKGLCANTVRHLMKNERSLIAVDAAIAYGKGEIDRKELNATVYVVYVITYADAAAYIAAHDPYSADFVAYATANASVTTRKANQMQTANICREIIGQEIIEKVNGLLNATTK